MKTNLNGEEGDWGYTQDFTRSMHSLLAPGPGLNVIVRTVTQCITTSFEKLQIQLETNRRVTLGLQQWLRHEMSMANTFAMYGPMNPVRDPTVERALW